MRKWAVRTLEDAMKNFFAAVLLLCSTCVADDASEMRDILQKNFDACNNEDVDALMETCSVDMPRRQEFRRESEKLWSEKDIYYRLVDFKADSIEGNYATAWVVQTSHVQNRSSSDERDEFFRNGTTLLTRKECVRYKVAFKKDGRSWRCYLTLTEPEEYDLDR